MRPWNALGWAMAAVPLFALLAGCASPDEDSVGIVAVRNSDARVTYGEGEQRLDMASRAADVWTTNATRVPGRLVVTGHTRGLTAFGMDACDRPTWAWQEEDDGPQLRFRDEGFATGWEPTADEVLWLVQPADLPARGNRDLERHGLHIHLERHGRAVHLEWERENGDEPQSIQALWRPDEPFPSQWGGLERTSWSNDGQPMSCQPVRPLEGKDWGPWGPEEDFPLGHSFRDAVAQALADPTLLAVQAFLREHPDAFIAEAIGIPDFDPGVLVPILYRDYHWQVSLGYPGASSGVGFTCDVRDGGPEEQDLYYCRDGITWTQSPPVEDPRFGEWDPLALAPFFELTQALAQREPGVIFQVGGGMFPAMMWTGAFEAGRPSLLWDAALGRMVAADDVPYQAFLDSQ